jgi:PAS domain S-box-containing protein
VNVDELQRLRLAIEASGEIMFMTDACGVFTYVNPEFVRTYGYESSEVVGRTTPRVLKSGSTDRGKYAVIWERLRRGRSVRQRFLNRTKGGALLHIESSMNPVADDAGEVVGFVAVQRDVTERTRIEAALKESDHRYRTLAEAAHDSIFIVNRAAQIEYANQISAARFGKTSDDVIGKCLDEVFPASVAAEMWSQLSTVFATGKRQLFEQRFESPRGELWLEAWLVPMRSEEGAFDAVMGVARDVTERKMLEQQFIQAQKMEGVGRLAGGVAHDFNNLLTVIVSYSDLVKEGLQERRDVGADVDEIRKAGERAAVLTRQLLAFSRTQPTARHVVDLNAVLADAKKMLERVLGEDIDFSVVPAPASWPIVVDPGQIEQVLMNLVVNARDAMPKGGRLLVTTANIELDDAFVKQHTDAVAGPYVSLTVRDSGCGMPPDVMARVFEPFFTTKPQGKGTGLGLSTVRDIVKQNGGYITIDSSAKSGTAVTIYWPKNDRREIAQPAANVSDCSLDGTETILLVEDDVAIRGLMRKALQRRGYRILEAHDVADAIGIAESYNGPIDVLLTDVIMPTCNGPDLAQRISTMRPNTRVLFVSGFPSCLAAEQRRSSLRTWFLPKPFTPQTLALNVRECLDWSISSSRLPAADAHTCLQSH